MALETTLARRPVSDAFGGRFAVASDDALRIEPAPMRSVLNLRGDATEDFTAAIEVSAGVSVPLQPNRWIAHHDRGAIWLGPDEWLLYAPDGEARAIELAVRAALPQDSSTSIVDVSHNYMPLLISGSAVRSLLQRGCSLDLHPRAFVNGNCAQTVLAKVPVLLLALGGDNSVEVWTRNSFGTYLLDWLADAARGLSRQEHAATC